MLPWDPLWRLRHVGYPVSPRGYRGLPAFASLSMAGSDGKEFAYHMEIAKVLKADGYFAHPYHSWERGLNENTNGLIRQYLSKGTDFNKLTDRQVLEIMDKLNNRPRKCLGYKTPNQVFFGIKPPVALAS